MRRNGGRTATAARFFAQYEGRLLGITHDMTSVEVDTFPAVAMLPRSLLVHLGMRPSIQDLLVGS